LSQVIGQNSQLIVNITAILWPPGHFSGIRAGMGT
jgi:hypothetical protein